MPDIKLTVIYGTETGNSEKLAKQVVSEANKKEYVTDLKSVSQLKASSLKDMGLLLVVISTWGEGDPPAQAEAFCKELYKATGADLSDNVLYSVLALGDKSYADFCGCGRRVDESIAKMGATRMLERKELDLDFDADFKTWNEQFFKRIEELAA